MYQVDRYERRQTLRTSISPHRRGIRRRQPVAAGCRMVTAATVAMPNTPRHIMAPATPTVGSTHFAVASPSVQIRLASTTSAMPRSVSDALSVSTRGADTAAACGTTSANGTLPWSAPHPCLAIAASKASAFIARVPMEPAEYALMDAAEDHMWWYRALHRRLLDALAGVHGTVLDAGCGTGGLLACLRSERAGPAPGRRGMGRPGRRPRRRQVGRADRPRQRQCAAVRRCLLRRRDRRRRAVPRARSIRRVRWPNCAACCARAAGWWSTCRPTPGCSSAHDRQVHNARRCTTRAARCPAA